jgi:hypothetical protein
MEEQIKFTDEEVQEIRNIATKVQSSFQRLGELEIRRDQLESVRSTFIEEYNSIREEEQKLFSRLNEKYGDGNYDPETNIFTPIKKEEETTAN